MDNIKPFLEYSGELITRGVLREYDRILENAMVSQRADCEMKLGSWLDDVLKSVENGRFNNKTKG